MFGQYPLPMRTPPIILIALLFLASCSAPSPVGCTEESMICPDGSVVVRNPATNCAFDACPDLSSTEACATSDDCPQITCITAPCPSSVCVDGFCELETCATFGRNGTQIQVCAACGDGVCNEYEWCVPSLSNEEIATADCGQLYCPEDCKENNS